MIKRRAGRLLALPLALSALALEAEDVVLVQQQLQVRTSRGEEAGEAGDAAGEDPTHGCAQSKAEGAPAPTAPFVAACSDSPYPKGTLDLRGNFGGDGHILRFDVQGCYAYLEKMKSYLEEQIEKKPGQLMNIIKPILDKLNDMLVKTLVCEKMRNEISHVIYQDCQKICITDFRTESSVHCQIADGKYVVVDKILGILPAQWVATIEDPRDEEEATAVGKVLVFSASFFPVSLGAPWGPDYASHQWEARRYLDKHGNLHFSQRYKPMDGAGAKAPEIRAVLRRRSRIACGHGYAIETCEGKAYPDTTAYVEPPCCCEQPYKNSFAWGHVHTATFGCEFCDAMNTRYPQAKPEKSDQCPVNAPYVAACTAQRHLLFR